MICAAAAPWLPLPDGPAKLRSGGIEGDSEQPGGGHRLQILLSPTAAVGAKGSSGIEWGMLFLSELDVVAMSPPELLTSKSFGSGTCFGSFRALEEGLLKFDFLSLPYGECFASGLAFIAAGL